MVELRENLINWLQDAHAMENQGVNMLEGLVRQLEAYPEIHDKILKHAEESRDQALKLEQCLKQLGKDTSTFKTGVGKIVGFAQALSGVFVDDEIVKGMVAGYVFEHYEIGNYKVLITAAHAAGEHEMAEIFNEIIQQEEEMAQWLGKKIPLMTQEFLGKGKVSTESYDNP